MQAMQISSKVAESALVCHLAQQCKTDSPLCDLTVHFPNKGTCSAHRAVVSTKSSYFHRRTNCLFSDSKKTDVSFPTELTDSAVENPKQSMTTVLQFIYGRTVTLRPSSVIEILSLAEYFCVDDLTKWCEALLYSNLVPGSVLQILQLSFAFGFSELALTALMMLAARFQDHVLHQTDLSLQALTIDHLRMLTPKGGMRFSTTDDRLNLLARWTSADPPHRLQHFNSLAVLWQLPMDRCDRVLSSMKIPAKKRKQTLTPVDISADVTGARVEEQVAGTTSTKTYIVIDMLTDNNGGGHFNPKVKPKEPCAKHAGYILDSRLKAWKQLPQAFMDAVSLTCGNYTEDVLVLVQNLDFYVLHVMTPFHFTGMKVTHYSQENRETNTHCLKTALEKSNKVAHLNHKLETAGLETAGFHKNSLYCVYSCRQQPRFFNNFEGHIMTFTDLPLRKDTCSCEALEMPFEFVRRRYTPNRLSAGLLSASLDDCVFVLSYWVGKKSSQRTSETKYRLLQCHVPTNSFCEYRRYVTEPYPAKSDTAEIPSFTADPPNKRFILICMDNIFIFSLETCEWMHVAAISSPAIDRFVGGYSSFPGTGTTHEDEAISLVSPSATRASHLNPLCQTSKCLFGTNFQKTSLASCNGTTVVYLTKLFPHVSAFVTRALDDSRCWEELTPPPIQNFGNLYSVEVPGSLLDELPVATYKSSFSGADLLRGCCPVSDTHRAVSVRQSAYKDS